MEATYFLSTTETNPRITETARLAAREPVLYELASSSWPIIFVWQR